MRRRTFLAAIAASAFPVRARAEPGGIVGFLGSGSAAARRFLPDAISIGLHGAIGHQARSIDIDYRWADGDYDRLPDLARELAEKRAAVIITDGTEATRAAKRGLGDLPVVFIVGSDPVKLGFVSSMSRPGGNLTGLAMLNNLLIGKRLELLHEIVPTAGTIALLINSDKDYARQTSTSMAVANSLGLRLEVVGASEDRDISAAFAKISEAHATALLVHADSFLDSRRDLLISLATRHRLPTSFEWREFPESGALMSYGVDIANVYRLAGGYAGKVLAGERPADLPVIQPSTYEFVVNTRAAKALGIAIPPQLLMRADKVIE